jgi:hypothetical protein
LWRGYADAVQGAKSAKDRERNAAKGPKAPSSQLKSNAVSLPFRNELKAQLTFLSGSTDLEVRYLHADLPDDLEAGSVSAAPSYAIACLHMS